MKILFFTLFHFSLFAEPLSVLIVGGGPAGLATAIEAKMQGCHVKVIEKRDAYTRPQTLFLQDSSLKLLGKWSVDTSPIKIADLGDGTLMGFISIHQLEQQLEKRALELGVEKIWEEFLPKQAQESVFDDVGLPLTLNPPASPNHKGWAASAPASLIQIQGASLSNSRFLNLFRYSENIPSGYDVIVGADGVHSSVREALGIKTTCLGTAKGAVVKILDLEDTSTEVDISPPIQIEGGFLRRTKVPKASLIFGQFPQNASKETLQRALDAQGWSNEAKALAENKALVGFEIDIVLQQASSFSNREKSAILIGDAAAAASFFQGMGANTALKTAEVAGHFFKEVQANKDAAFQNYNQAVKKLTTEMIEDSAFLFKKTCN